jgi:hypothetical protein
MAAHFVAKRKLTVSSSERKCSGNTSNKYHIYITSTSSATLCCQHMHVRQRTLPRLSAHMYAQIIFSQHRTSV